MADDALFTIAGQEFKVTSPDRLFYRATGTTKLDVIQYYAGVSSAMLPHVQGRPATRKRWPEGVDKASFFVKDLEPGTPGWLPRVQILHGSGPKFYPVFDSPATLAWLGQVAALELHVPQWRIEQPAGPTQVTGRRDERQPDRVVFDLDPGPGSGLAECVDVALALRERLGPWASGLFRSPAVILGLWASAVRFRRSLGVRRAASVRSSEEVVSLNPGFDETASNYAGDPVRPRIEVDADGLIRRSYLLGSTWSVDRWQRCLRSGDAIGVRCCSV